MPETSKSVTPKQSTVAMPNFKTPPVNPVNQAGSSQGPPAQETVTQMREVLMPTNIQATLHESRGGHYKQATVDIISKQLRDKRKNLRRLGTGVKSKSDWDDSELVSREYIDVSIYRLQEEKTRHTTMLLALKTITTEASLLGVSAIMCLAWNLRSTEDKKLFIFNENPMASDGHNPSQLDGTILVHDEEGVIYEESYSKDKFDKIEREASYLCASVLRLAAKDSESLVRAWDTIKRQYMNFYQEDMTLDLKPSSECLKRVRVLLQDRTIVKNTLAMFLLSYHGLVGNNKGICRMLFELHLSYTGMHAYNLLLFCSQRTGTPLEIMVSLLEHPNTRRALDQAKHLLHNYEFPQSDEEVARAERGTTWRYARLFDAEAFGELQTKNAMMLASILALVAHKIGTTGSGDVTKIRQIANMIENNREAYNKYADRIMDYIRSARQSEASYNREAYNKYADRIMQTGDNEVSGIFRDELWE